MIAFFSLGFDTTNFVIIAGTIGVGIGLGMQSMLNNFFSGLVMMFQKVVKVGDIIELEDGETGKIKAIRIQNIHMRTFDGKDLIVPNSQLLSNQITNYTMHDSYLRIRIPFGISYSTDIQKLHEVVLKAVEDLPFIIKNESIAPAPKLFMEEFGDNSINFELAFWVNLRSHASQLNIKAEALSAIEKALRNNNIEIPFPQRDIRVLELPEKPSRSSL